MNQIVSVVVVYRTRMLAVMDSKQDNSFPFLLSFCFPFFYLVSSFRVNFGLD